MASETPGAGIGSDDPETKRGPLGRWVDSAIKNPDRVYRAMFYVAMLFFLVTTLFPFYWLLVLALTPNNLIANMGLVPNGFNPEVFIAMFERVPFHLYMFNSFVLGITTTVLVLLIASLAGYVFGRLRFPGKGVLMLGILAISYFPPAAFLIPLFELFTGNTAISIGMVTISTPDLFNTPAPMVFPFSALFLPLSIFILTTFYGQIPDGLEDAARVEGTTRLGALFRVIVPLSAPGVATAGVLTFISVYNEFFFSFLMNNGEADSWAPIVAGILKYQGQFDTPYNLMAAASIVGVLPVAILVIIAQERIVSGLTAGALKE
ncbi:MULTISPECIES: carbohydrate ABC transporter permease [Haloferax]|uniref:ABC transporter permease subunit n=5 Tax=Haloferax TaxID=2251 RepID=A0A6C0UW11_HALVO|nr:MULTISPECIES: carbohydrate ABC transporter permease [Haloferax]ELZ78870.1 putative sugar ABC transporter permease [Haloferax lucentense DSM 14919]ELZ86323.1 putative sugar ABC transporter permease [Haloferax alexandrinus JCM 10717]NLV04303.1 ABC transporter permease subunit [Haloferax alexandrinus]QIB79736.1 carbohydrate ABC transporter permease [Haloferax alexandrinus]RDZ31702.1 carbohydrate ABC transporter permease [Haloferax sp. Atlit-48N]